MNKDGLGDRIKVYEKHETSRVFIPGLPIVARMDGKAFHTFTYGMKKPFDPDLVKWMQQTCQKLVEDTGADIGYVQSDEITLIWKNEDINAQMWLGGKAFKWHSLLASMTTGHFNWFSNFYNRIALFDARVFQVSSLVEASNVLVWREQDAVRNSVQMLARSLYSHKECDKKNISKLQEMCFQKGHNWNDLDSELKRGTYYKRVHVLRKFNEQELSKLPHKHQAHNDPNLMVERKDVVKWDIDIITKYDLDTRLNILFNDNMIKV